MAFKDQVYGDITGSVIYLTLARVIRECFADETKWVTHQARLAEELLLDDEYLAALMLAINDEFGIKIDMSEATRLKTIADVVRRIAEKLAEKDEESEKGKGQMMEERLIVEDFEGIVFSVAKSYDILENEDSELLFVVAKVEAERVEYFTPRLYYDGGAHAILIKNRTTGIICDHVHPGVRKSLGRAKNVLFGEVEDDEIAEEYYAVLHIVPYPDVEALAGLYIKPLGGAGSPLVFPEPDQFSMEEEEIPGESVEVVDLLGDDEEYDEFDANTVENDGYV